MNHFVPRMQMMPWLINPYKERLLLSERLQNELKAEQNIKLSHNGPKDTDLINAVTSGSIIEIEKVLKERYNYSQEALDKSLVLAANNGQKLILILLLKYGADKNWTDDKGNTPLMVCAERGFLDMAKILLASDADAKKINTSGNTALILSIKASGAEDLVKLLVSSSNVNVKNNIGQTALSKAVESGDLKTIYILISNGANLNDVVNGETIQEFAAKKGMLKFLMVLPDCNLFKLPPFIEALKYKDISLLDIILTYEPNSICQRTSEGCNALEAFFNLIISAEKGFTSVDKSIVKFLIASGVNKKEKEPNRSGAWRLSNESGSLLVKAVQLGDLDIVRWLCILGLGVNESDNADQLTPLMMASKCGFTDITHFLLSKRADTAARRKEGTALDIAVKYGNLDCATVLLRVKAKIELLEAYIFAIESKHLCLLEDLVESFRLNTKEVRLLELAIQSGSIESFRYLINKGMAVNKRIAQHHSSQHKRPKFVYPLHIAVIKEKPDFIKVLLQSKADINRKDSNGNTALSYAFKKTQKKSSEMLTLLVESGSNVNIANNMGRTPLFYAIKNADIMNVTLLLNSGASVDICDNIGETPMLKAIQSHNLELVSLLIDWKADTSAIADNGGTYITELVKSFKYFPHDSPSETIVQMLKLFLKETIDINKQDDNGDTALMIACKSHYSMFTAVEILLEHGADVNLVNHKNKTALFISLKKSNFSLAKILLQRRAQFYPISICQQGVQLFVCNNEEELIPLALGNGVFPFVAKSGYSSDQNFYISYTYGTYLSPLYLSLYERRLDLAKYLIQVRFLTKYDVSDLLKTDIFQETIRQTEQGTIFNNLLSLYTLSFVQISEMLGATLDREDKVNRLPLPSKIKQQLLFRSLNVPLTL